MVGGVGGEWQCDVESPKSTTKQLGKLFKETGGDGKRKRGGKGGGKRGGKRGGREGGREGKDGKEGKESNQGRSEQCTNPFTIGLGCDSVERESRSSDRRRAP